MLVQYFVEVPNREWREETPIQEPVSSLDEAYPLCYDLAQEYGEAEVCWYALNGKRVSEGHYSAAFQEWDRGRTFTPNPSIYH